MSGKWCNFGPIETHEKEKYNYSYKKERVQESDDAEITHSLTANLTV